MAVNVVTVDGASPPSGPFAPATMATGTRILSVSGQVALGEDGEVLGKADAQQQARECLAQIDALLNAAGASKTDVVKIGVYLTDISDRGAVASARTEYFGDHKPASTLFAVAALVSPDLKVEIEATAVF